MDWPLPGQNLTDGFHVRVFVANATTIGRWWRRESVQRHYWRLYRNDRDGARLFMAGKSYPLRGGRLYVIPTGFPFGYRTTRRVNHFWVHFDVVGLPGVVMRELFGGPLCLPPSRALENAVDRLEAELQSGQSLDPVRQCRVKSIIYQGLALYLESLSPEAVKRCWQLAAAQAPVLPALQHIEANLSQRLSNRQLSALCFMSGDYFIRRFRECVGQTPQQYVLERRLVAAAQRLVFTDDGIERIAAETGFGNRFYFSRVFARHFGLPPATYRKQGRT